MVTTRKETVQVIKDLIAGWVIKFVINSVIDNMDGTYKLMVPKTYYLVAGERRYITINLIKYSIVDVVNNCSVTIKGSTLPPSDTFNLPVPFFFNGTLIEVNSEIKREKDISKKTPMIYLRRPFTERIDARDLINTDIANKCDLTLYFLTESKFDAWDTAAHDKFAILPMRNLAYEFIELLKKNIKFISRLTDAGFTDLIKFGLVTQDGVTKGYFSDNYSGVGMDISIGIRYQCIECGCQ